MHAASLGSYSVNATKRVSVDDILEQRFGGGDCSHQKSSNTKHYICSERVEGAVDALLFFVPTSTEAIEFAKTTEGNELTEWGCGCQRVGAMIATEMSAEKDLYIEFETLVAFPRCQRPALSGEVFPQPTIMLLTRQARNRSKCKVEELGAHRATCIER